MGYLLSLSNGRVHVDLPVTRPPACFPTTLYAPPPPRSGLVGTWSVGAGGGGILCSIQMVEAGQWTVFGAKTNGHSDLESFLFNITAFSQHQQRRQQAQALLIPVQPLWGLQRGSVQTGWSLGWLPWTSHIISTSALGIRTLCQWLLGIGRCALLFIQDESYLLY